MKIQKENLRRRRNGIDL